MQFQSTGDSFKVNSDTSQFNEGSKVAVAANGDFVVVWKRPFNGNSNDDDIFFRRFNADGTPKDSSDRIVTNRITDEEKVDVSMAADGSFVVTWIETVANTSQGRLFFQRFDAAGNKLGSAQQVSRNGGDGSRFERADVAMFDDGSFIIASTYAVTAGVVSTNLFLDFFDKDGSINRSEGIVTPEPGLLGNPSIAVRPGFIANRIVGQSFLQTGSIQFIVTWDRFNSSTNSSDVYFRTYDGIDALTPIRIATTKTENEQVGASAAIDNNGNFVITWTDQFASGDRDVRFRRFNASGAPLAADEYVNGSSGNQSGSSIAMASDGRFAVSYTNALTGRTEIKQYAANGTSVGSVINFDNVSAKPSTVVTNREGTRMIAVATGSSTEGVLARVFATPAPTVQLSQATYQVSEAGGSSNVVMLTRTGETFASSQVRVNITGGTANAGADYTSTNFPLTVNFAAGETSKAVVIPILQDTTVEGTEAITFSITGVSNAAIGTTNTATLQILDDDIAASTPTPTPTPTPTSDQLIGDAAANTLVGNARDNLILGKGGNDNLTGGDGRDQFVFDVNARFSRRAIGVDVINDFARGVDKIVLDRTTFTKLGGSALRPAQFASVRTVQQAKSSRALVTYVRSTGALFYNENGIRVGFGTGGQFADLTNGLALTRADISVVA